jgi:hypothetical protein
MGGFAERPPEWKLSRSQLLAPTRKLLSVATRRRSLQNPRDRVRVVATFFAIRETAPAGLSARRYQPEQVVNLLRQIEVAIANGKATAQGCKWTRRSG